MRAPLLLLAGLMLGGCLVSTDYTAPSPEQALPVLLAVLKDPDEDLRRTAAQALGKLASPEAVPALHEALRDSDAGVRRYAAWALGMIGDGQHSRDGSPLVPVLFDPDPAVREAAATALGRTGETQAGIVKLMARLQEPGVPADTKRLAVAALGAMEARSATGLLLRFLGDPDPLVRRWTVAALAEIGDQRAVDPLAAVLRRDSDPGVRLEAAFRFRSFGGETGRAALTAALQDSDGHVRQMAAVVLQELHGAPSAGGPS